MSLLTFDKSYSNNWKNLGSALYYRHPNFQFKNTVIITDLYNCLTSHLSQSKFYDTRNAIEIELYDEDYVKHLSNSESSIIIVSNTINQSKLNIDMIKRTLEAFVEKTNIPVLGLFVLSLNCLSKPHTGSWKLLNALYKREQHILRKAIVVSNNGGLIIEREKRNGYIDTHVAYSDLDRCYAYNIGMEYYSIDEYLDLVSGDPRSPYHGKKVKFAWNTDIIPPEIRLTYCSELAKMPPINLLDQIQKMPARDAYLIFVMGPPRCGKTRACRMLKRDWEKSSFGESNAIKHIERSKVAKSTAYKTFTRCIDDRISVIIDSGCDTRNMRSLYLEYASKKNINVVFIEIVIGHQMAKVLNHACIEDAIDETLILYKSRDYNIYQATFERPKPDECEDAKYIYYYPTIEMRPSVVKYRY